MVPPPACENPVETLWPHRLVRSRVGAYGSHVDRADGPVIRLCGRFEAAPRGRDVSHELPGRQGRLLLAFLAYKPGRPVTRDQLIDLIWPHDPPAVPDDVLGSILSKVRRALGPGVIEGRHDLTLVLPEGARVDVEIAADATERAEAALATGDAGLASGDAKTACELTEGGFLPGFDNPWVEERRREVEELRLRALESAAGAGLALGGVELTSAERAARELISAAPLSELGYRLLMEILAARGDVAAALQVFDLLRVALRDELGIAPGPAARALHERLLVGAEHGDAPVKDGTKPREAPRREERKLVTVLAAEPRIEASEDPEELRARRASSQERIRLEVERFGGTIAGTGGSSVLALFGASAAHEDDAERAVRAAVRLRELGLAACVGAATSEVLVAPPAATGQTATGRAVDDALRIQRAAPPGGVLADELTVRAIPPDSVVCDAHDDATWAVQAVSHRLGVALEHPGRTPFLGRNNELGLLASLHESMLERERPSMVVLLGNAGVGKSRLIDEFVKRTEGSEPSVYRGRCLAYGEGITYWALREVLCAASEISLDDSAATAETKLRECVRAVVPAAEADRVAAALAVSAGITLSGDPLAGVAPASVREEISLAWPAFVSGLASRRATVVVIEDLHWAEEPLLELIERVVARATGPVLLIVSARPEFAEARPGWSARTDTSQIGLQPLPDRYARELVACLLPSAGAEVRQRVVAAAEGNPFFAEQLARHLETENAPAAVPGGIRGLLAARVDGLPAAEKRALQDAAVIGRVFWPIAIESIEAQPGLDDTLRALERRGLLVTHPNSSLPGHIELSFGHGLVREVAYQSIPRAQRCRAHAAVGAWLEHAASDRREELIELIAHHYERAASGEDAALAWPQAPRERDRLRGKAVAALIEAGEVARRRSSLEQALRYAERAQTHVRDERERLAAFELIARTHHAAARPDDALAAYLAAIGACRALGDHEAEVELRAWAMLVSARYFGAHSTAWQARAVELLREGVADDTVGDWSFARAAQLIGRWGLRVRAGVDERTVDDAKRDAEHAVAIAETTGPPELVATALEVLTWTTLEQGFCDADVMGKRLISASMNSPDRFEAHECLVAAALCYGWSGRYERSREIGREAAARAALLTPHRQLHAAAAQTLSLAPTGRFAELGLATDRVVELVAEEADRTCGQARVALAGRLLWLFESLEPVALKEGLELFDRTRPTRYGGAESAAGGIEPLRHVIGNESARARIAAVDPGGDKAAAVLCLRVELPVLALSGEIASLDAAIARARTLADEACAPALGWIAEWATTVQLATDDPALALKRAARATDALARYGERYTAARLLCDLLPLVTDVNGVADIANQTAAELETMGALASAAQAVGALAVSR